MRDTARRSLVVAEEVELDFIGTGAGQVKVVEALTVRRHHRLVGYAVRVLPVGRLRLRTARTAFGSPASGPASRPASESSRHQAFLVGVAVLRDDRRDPLRMADGEPAADRRAVVQDVQGEPSTPMPRSSSPSRRPARRRSIELVTAAASD